MPAPRLPQLDPAVETTVFRALVDVLQADPVLADVVQQWDVLDSTTFEIVPPGTSEMPFIRLMPGPSNLSMAEAAAWELDYTIFAMIATPGLHADDQLNMWGAFRKALNYQAPFRDTTVSEYLRNAGCTLHQLTSPGFGPYPPPAPDRASRAQDLFGAARVLLKLTIPF